MSEELSRMLNLPLHEVARVHDEIVYEVELPQDADNCVHVWEEGSIFPDPPLCGIYTSGDATHPECRGAGGNPWPIVGLRTDWKCPSCGRSVCATCRDILEIRTYL